MPSHEMKIDENKINILVNYRYHPPPFELTLNVIIMMDINCALTRRHTTISTAYNNNKSSDDGTVIDSNKSDDVNSNSSMIIYWSSYILIHYMIDFISNKQLQFSS